MRELIFRRRLERRQHAIDQARANREAAQDERDRQGGGFATDRLSTARSAAGANPWADEAAAARDGLDWLTFDAESAAARAAATADADENDDPAGEFAGLTVGPEEALRRWQNDPDAAMGNSLPTLSDVWRAARECPLPVDVHSLEELVLALNASERSHPNYEATTLATLVAELTSRDPAAGIRLRNMVRHRRARGAALDRLTDNGRPEAHRVSARRARDEGEPLWRAYVADLDSSGGRGASRLYEHLPPSMGAAGVGEGAFEIFSQRRRVLARGLEGRGSEGSGAPSEQAPTPFAGLGEAADTPASSVGLSPAQVHAADCPASPPALSRLSPPPVPLTSADLAEQLARARRSIAPMPQPRGRGTESPGLGVEGREGTGSGAEAYRARLRGLVSPLLRDEEEGLREAAMAAMTAEDDGDGDGGL